MDKLDDKDWIQSQVNIKPLRRIAGDMGVPYSRFYRAIKKLDIKIPKRTKYFYTEESRKAKSDHIKAALEVKYPDGRYGKLAANWKGGMPECIDCGKPLARKDAIRCQSCERSDNRTGSKNINWRGGIWPENARARNTNEYKAWRKAVLERDDYTCQKCGRNRYEEPMLILHAGHIKSFSEHSDLRLDINNGQTLCFDCHKDTDDYAGKANKRYFNK